jgi:squalene cyclase
MKWYIIVIRIYIYVCKVLGVYEWSGMKAIPPETWLLPYFVPFHPGRHLLIS